MYYGTDVSFAENETVQHALFKVSEGLESIPQVQKLSVRSAN